MSDTEWVATADFKVVLHALRNPYGYTEDEMRAIRLRAADIIEELGSK